MIFFDKPDNNNNVDNLILSNECFRYTEKGAIIENYCDDEEHKYLEIPSIIDGITITEIENIDLYYAETIKIPNTIKKINNNTFIYNTFGSLEKKQIINESQHIEFDCSKLDNYKIYSVENTSLLSKNCNNIIKLTQKENKEVPININLSTISNYEEIENIILSNEKVVLNGYKELLLEINSIDAYIDSERIENKTYNLELKEPYGIDSINLNNITADIKLGEVITNEYIVNLDIRNLNDKYSIEFVNDSDKNIKVYAKGTNNNLSNLNITDINAYLDLYLMDEPKSELEVQKFPVFLKTKNNKVKLESSILSVELKIKKNN